VAAGVKRTFALNDIATPTLSLVGDLHVEVSPPVDIGQTPYGVRRVIPLLGGYLKGPRLNARLIPGGADFQVWRNDNCTEIHARYILETETGARIYVENSGLRHGPAEAMQRLARGEQVDPALIYFRTVARFEASAPELAWLMRGIFLTSGARFPDRVAIRFFEVL
jgi:hypothetical protein